MSLYRAHCDRCKYERELREVLRSYRLDDSLESRLTIRMGFAWCSDCRAAVWAEEIEDISTLEAELTELSTHGEELFSYEGENWRNERDNAIRTTERRLEWRRARVSEAKCLECGSHDISLLPRAPAEDDESHRPIVHPGCGGMLAVSGVGLSLSRLWVFYTPEGDRIDTYEAFPSKGLVKRDSDGRD